MKNEKVTIKQKKIMIQYKKTILTLVALLAVTIGAWADETPLVTIESKNYTSFTSGSMTFDDKVTVTFSGAVSNSGDWGWYHLNGTTLTVTPVEGITITRVKFTCAEGSAYDETAPFEAVLGDPWSNPYMLVNGNSYGYYGVTKIEVYGTAGPKVTFNEAKTTASFEMPGSDVTVSYELVRDMAVDVDATIADRIRIKKENNDYVVVTDGQLTPAVSDKISGTAVAMTVTTDYTAQLQKKTEGDTPSWADAEALSVGTFRYVITGAGLYDGEITTNEFQLFEGYEVTIPAGEYITYYKDEALYVENENAKLYTIASITETEAVLSSEISVAPALTPLLVFNSSDEAKTFLLIPTTDKTPDNVTAATQFVGTLVATTIPASATGADNYALNGYAFVWVKTAIEVGANKCWLHIASQTASTRANTRSIIGGNGTTGIDAIEKATIDNEGWYDLQGRKLQSAPNRGGIYIHNGKKVVVRK